ncbi:probable asparagine--tRNA ligase, mitochondrial [Anoplophora glabripennis]|nr:probable asparagine--tRNA ligase, mitochondrial [Anoplophora glabripennis]
MIRYCKNYSNYIKHHFKRNCSTKTTSVINILKLPNAGEKISVKGWVKAIRKQKENVFIDLNDGSTEKKLQILIPHKCVPKGLSTGSSISADGILHFSPKGQIELSTENINIIGPCSVADGYPIAPKKHYSPDYTRQYPHLRPRTKIFSSLLRVRSEAVLAINNYFNSRGYVYIHTPVLTCNDCEGAGEVFKAIPDNVNLLKQMAKEETLLEEAFFDKKVFLSVSGQLHLEAAAHGLSKVYTLGPTFRAENSRSRLHLSEFYMLEAEVAFLDKIEDVMVIIEEFMKNVTKTLLETCESDIQVCREKTVDMSWVNKNFAVLDYDEAVDILRNNRQKFKDEFYEQSGISKEHEIFLVHYCGDIPTFIINWPKAIKPFYMRECEGDNEKVAALDLLAPGVGEIVGGSLRENDYNKLKEKLPEAGAKLDWYLDLRKFGGVPTGGFGLGFERYLLFLLGINNIKDTLPFPRWPHNCNL